MRPSPPGRPPADRPARQAPPARQEGSKVWAKDRPRKDGPRKDGPRKDWPGKDRPRKDRPHEPERGPRGAAAGDVILYGWHTVKAALENPARRIRKLYATANAARRLAEDGVTVVPEMVRPDALAHRLGPDAVHNGLLAEADPLPALELDDLAPAGIVLVLDQITDPHNVGAILRTAAGFAVAAVVTTARHSPEATGVLAKSASGALEYVPIVTVPNLARALALLREQGYLLVGLDGSGEVDLGQAELRTPLALVLGAEGKGLRQLTRASCDVVARLDLPGRIKSLNVSNAAALALYVASKPTVSS
jgi:23S rRNA (guanosine2251-2'-O)-methyltransferase